MMIEGPDIGLTTRIASAAVLVFFGGLFAWSVLAPLESAAVAFGEVGAEGKQKIIKHLEGGIVDEIHVREGDHIATGQTLIKLDDTQARANFSIVTSRYLSALALQARLQAERDGLPSIVFPSYLLAAEDENLDAILQAQENIFRARRASLQNSRDILQQHIAQSESEMAGLVSAIKSQTEQLSFAHEEIAAYIELEERGMSAGKTRLLAVQKDHARIEGERSKNEASVSKIQQSIGEIRLRLSTLQADHLNEVLEQLREVESELFDLNEKLLASRDILYRTTIRAPIDGRIVGLQIHTPGGVIGSGETLLRVVPSKDRLVIDARLNPADIDVVHPGLVADIRFPAFSSQTYSPISGRVISVSADRMEDERSGESYYSVSVEVTGDLQDELEGETLYPGMLAEVMIITGSRSALEYLVEPIFRSFEHAFRES